jgi:quercetin dioxygenase-like cupin family protein
MQTKLKNWRVAGVIVAGRKKIVLAAVVATVCAAATLTYAMLPQPPQPPSTVPTGTLVGQTSVNVLSVAAFTRAINQAHGINAVLQHLQFTPGQSTGWHTHPGPNIVLVVAGSLTLTDEHCNVTTYGPLDQGFAFAGFATGLKVHQAVAGPDGSDFYTFYFLPSDADVLRTNADPPGCASN